MTSLKDQQQATGGRPFVLHTRVVTGTGGGPEKTILNSPRYLRRYGIDSACLFMRPTDDAGFDTLREKAATAGAPIIEVDDDGPLDRRVFRQCLQACRRHNVTIWHGHDYKSNALGLALKLFHPMHVVTTAHGWVKFTARTPLYYWVDRLCMKRYEQVISVSEDLQQRCAAAGIRRERLSLIDNAIIADDYDPSPATVQDKRRFGFSADTVLLGAVGRLSEEKGFDLLIDAVHQLVQDGHRIGLVIAGEGPLRAALQQQIDQLQLQGHVVLAGFLADPRELYRAIDIFVLSSLREGLPNVVLEAMASQRVVITTRVNGIPRLVRDSENGIVVDPGSATNLYNAIQRCLKEPNLCRELAWEGRQTVVEEFSFEKRMEHVVGVYRSLSGELAYRILARPLAVASPDQPPVTSAHC